MLNWIGILGKVYRPRQHLDLFVMFLKPFLSNLQCGRVHYLVKGTTAIQEHHEGVYMVRNILYVGGTCQRNIHMNARTKGVPAEHCLHRPDFFPLVNPAAITSPGKQCTWTQKATRSKRKCDSSDQTTSFHCSVVQFWHSHAYLDAFGSEKGGLNGYSYQSAATQPNTQQTAMHCIAVLTTFLSWPALCFSAIWATLARLCDWKGLARVLRGMHDQ